MFHVVDVHGRTNRLAIRANSFFEDIHAVLIGIAAESGDGGGTLGPLRIGVNGGDPDRSALHPVLAVELALRVARRVAFGAFGDFFDEIFSALNLRFLGRGGGFLDICSKCDKCSRQQEDPAGGNSN